MAPRITVDQAPDPDGGRDLKSAFEVMITRTGALEEAILQQTKMMQTQLDSQTRMQLVGSGRQDAQSHVAGAMAQFQPRMRSDVLHGLTSTGGVPADMTMGITKMTGTRALTSIQNLHAFGAQKLGQMIAGPDYQLYEGDQQAAPTPAKTRARRRPQGMGQQIAQGAAVQPGEAPDVLSTAGLTLTPQPAQSSEKLMAKGVKEGVEEAQAETGGGMSGLAAGVAGVAAEAMRPQRTEIPAAAISGMPAPSGAQAPAGGAAGGAGGGPGGPGGPAGGGAAAPGAGPGGGAGAGSGGQAGAAAAATLRQNLGARVAMSGGTPGGILGMLSKVPILGLGAEALGKVADIYSSQREAGRVYQETEGGSNLQAQQERYRSMVYQASMFGRVPDGVAAQMFGQVTAMGYNNAAVNQGQQLQNRTSALNLMYHQYTATGTTPDQSAEILATASQNATISLKTVSDAMTTLSDTAGKAGTNAQTARENFNALLDTAIQAGAGPGAAAMAGGQATTQASYGNASKSTSFAGISGANQQYMLAGQTGMTPAQVQFEQRTNPQGYATLYSGQQMQFINQLPGMTPQLMASLQQMIQAAGGAAQIKTQPALAQQIGNSWLNQYQASNPGLDMNVWASFLSQVSGVKLAPGQVMQWVVEQVAGNNVASNTTNAAGGSAGGGGGGAGGSVSAGAVAAGTSYNAPTGQSAAGAAVGQYGLAKAVGGTGLAGQALSIAKNALPFGLGGLIPGASKHGSSTWQQVLQASPDAGGAGKGGAGDQYLNAEKKTGQRNPVLEALMQNVPKGTQVAVKTASGTRVMDFSQAMQFYPNEMEAGDVQFYTSSGQNLGSTANITQGLVDPTANVSAEQSGKSGTNVGVSLSQFQKTTGAASGGGTTVDLSADAKKLLKLLPSNSDNAAAAAAPPANPLPSSSSR